MSDTITIIRARGRRLAKLIHQDGKIDGYDAAKTFDLTTQPVADLDALHSLLSRMVLRPDCAVVRGDVIDPTLMIGVRRLAYDDAKTGDTATLRAASHHWLALDLDGVERAESVAADDLPACAAEAIQRLPVAFHDARCIVQASASHGIKSGSRLRLWFWLDRPASGAELTRWLRNTPADPSVFRTAQLIYTAAPIFAPGAHDPIPHRIAELPGHPVVTMPSPDALAPPPPRPAPPMPKPTDAGAGRYAFAALVNAASRVQRAGIGQRHDTILREARGLARFVNHGLLNQQDVAATLRGAGANAGKPVDEIESLITWAIAHPSGAALPVGVVR